MIYLCSLFLIIVEDVEFVLLINMLDLSFQISILSATVKRAPLIYYASQLC